VDLNIGAEHLAGAAVQRETVHHRQRVRWHSGAKPLDDVAVVVIVRGLDKHNGEALDVLAEIGLRCGIWFADGHPEPSPVRVVEIIPRQSGLGAKNWRKPA
jgi:hypothetical protein